jgi:hypothetical protein
LRVLAFDYKQALEDFMNKLKNIFFKLLALLVLGLVGFIFINYYSLIFSKKVSGKLDRVEKLDVPIALLQGQLTDKVFSFAIAVRDEKGEIYTASTEDRQWAAATIGTCVEAIFEPYPPWDFKKHNTYHNARLKRSWICN